MCKFIISIVNGCDTIRDHSQIMTAIEWGRGVWKMLTIADREGEGVWQMITITDKGGGVIGMLTITDQGG